MAGADSPPLAETAAPTADASSPAEREWTEEQRRAIDRRQGDLLLDAAAGSGKTSVLVERFVRSVLDDGVAVGAILTITFTEKAAAELRDRIRVRLRALGAADAARATESAFISTIHGFCARVLRGHALAAGLDPRFEVLDATRCGGLAADAFDAALKELAESGSHSAQLVEMIAAYGVPALRSATASAHDALRSGGELHPSLPSLGPAPGQEVTQALHAAARALAAELASVEAPGVRVVTALERVTASLELGEPASCWPAGLEGYGLPRGGGALSTDACAAYAEALAAFRAAAARHAAAPIRDALDALLREFSARYAEAKDDASGLDFTDLELLTRRLFADDPALREHYRSRFASIMVDELQDTNRVQLELIELIADDNLFTVGDAQQSIYGFRHADVELFRERGRQLERAGRRETLRTNFRTRPEIIDALNPAFAEAMNADFTPLRAGRAAADDGPPAGPRTELLVADKGADWELEGMASPWRLAEARALARRVGALVAAGTAPGQIVVLLRAGTDMRAYERALEHEGLPTYVIGGRGYWAHPQVIDMVAYLRTLANPRDEEPLYGVLVSPLVGLSLDGLVILAAAARAAGRDPWSIVREDPSIGGELSDADADRLEAFAGWFGAERVRSSRAGIEDLLDEALTMSGYDLEMLALPGGRRRLANVRKLMRLGREHEAAHGPDLRGFLALIADREAGRAPDDREGEAPVEGEGLDAIRLMTIHRAKGLEFDVVCVADLGRSPRPPSEILRVSRDGRLGLRLVRTGEAGRESALHYTAIGEERKAAEEREERRLFYVAMTRARERLLLSGAAKLSAWAEGNPRAGGGPICWIAPAFVPELTRVVADGGGEARVGDGGRVAVSFAQPQDESPGGAAAAAAPDGPVAPVSPVAPVGPAAPLVPGAPTAPGGARTLSGFSGEAPQNPLGVAAGTGTGAAGATRAVGGVDTLSYSSLTEYGRCGYRFYVERVLGLPALDPSAAGDGPRPGADGSGPGAGGSDSGAGASGSGAGGRRRGILAHAMLQRLDFRNPVVPGPDVARAAAVRAGLDPAPGPAELDGLAAVVGGFARSSLCARLARCTDVRREQRFAFPLAEDPTWPLVVGALDVLARDPADGGDARLVVDYKTDRLDGEAPADVVRGDYAVQQLVYAIVVLHAGAATVEIVHLFLQAPDAPVSVRFERAELDGLRARLRSLAAGARSGSFPVAPDPHRALCRGCPAQDGLCSWPVALTRRETADTLF